MANDMTENKDKQTVRKIMENRRAEANRREIAYIAKTGNLTVDAYAGFKPKTLGKNVPRLTADNEFLLIQHAVLNGFDKEACGNCYVDVNAVKNGKTMKLREGETVKKVMQAEWDTVRKDGKDKSHFVEVVNASQLEKFAPHNKLVTGEQREAVIKALEKKAFNKLETGSTKDGKPKYDAVKDIAYIPETQDRVQYAKDLVYLAASREVAKRTMEKYVKENENVDIKFHNREVGSSEQLLLKHFVAAQLRMKLQLGADERNGLGRENPASVKESVNMLKRDEKMLSNLSRRGGGITYKMETVYFKGVLSEKQAQKKTVDKGLDKGMND